MPKIIDFLRYEPSADERIAKINAKRDIKLAKINNEDRAIAACVIVFFVLITVIVVGIIFRPEREKSLEQQKIEQQRYETCMQYEEDEVKC